MRPPFRRFLRSKWAIVAALVFVKAVLHFTTATRYGYFRDEFYYLACGEHLSWGFVDHPPFTPFVAQLTRHTLGVSLRALRTPPILATTLLVPLVGLMTHKLGGGRLAVLLSGIAVLVSPAFLVMGTFLSVNSFDLLWWTTAILLTMLLIEKPRPGLWVLLGLVVGVGLLTKYTIVLLIGGVFVGLLLTPNRRQLRGPWPWTAALIALALACPNLLWQHAHGWPTIDFLHNIRLHKNYPVSALEFVAMQVAVVHPLLFPLWIAGLVYLLFARAGRRYRLFGWMYLFIILTLMCLQGKFYYAFPIYPVLFAAGAVAAESWFARPRRKWLAWATPVLMLAGGAVTLPYALPVLPFQTFLQYERCLDIHQHIRFEKGRDRRKPIIYADMLGWPSIVEGVRSAYYQLGEPDRYRATILTENYGEAGAIDLLGAPLGLPHAVSGHNSYYLWGPGERSWDVVVAVGMERDDLRGLFESVTPAGTVRNDYAREVEVPIFVCRHLVMPLDEAWQRLRHYH